MRVKIDKIGEIGNYGGMKHGKKNMFSVQGGNKPIKS
jgi:hypothetical protein